MPGDDLPSGRSSPGIFFGTTGFEPATSCTPSKRATRLRHAPKLKWMSKYYAQLIVHAQSFQDRESPAEVFPEHEQPSAIHYL